MGFFNRSTKPSDDLVENGIRGTAVVEKANMGAIVNYDGLMRQKTAEKLLSGETSMTRYKLDLRVDVPGRASYSARISVSVPMGKVPFMSGGSVLPVLVDPNKPDRINVDWDGEFRRGTLSEMSAANPLVAAAMRGAGVDVEKISQAQREAQAAGRPVGNVIMGGELLGAHNASPTVDPLDRLKKLGDLHESGILSDQEFADQKAKILGEG